MTQRGPLCWRTGAGWLVLAGGGRWQNGETGEIDAAVLGWASPDRPMVVLLAAGGSTAEGEALLEYYADLGGPGGSITLICDPSSARQAENCRLLAEAGLVYIAGGPGALSLVQALSASPALEALAQAFDGGAVVVGMGVGAVALGAWVAGDDDPARTEPGWGWLANVIVEPHFAGAESTARLRTLLNVHPDCLGLGVPEQVALALGPDGRVETVGEGQVTVVVSA